MTIAPKPLLAAAYMRQAELNPLADTADLLDAVESERQALREVA